MNEPLPPGRQDRVATLLGWAIFATFAVLFFNILNLPRTPLDQRAPLQLMHDSLGLIVGLLCFARLYWFVRGPSPRPPEGLPPASFAFNRTILLVLFLTFAAEFVIGMFYAWGEHRQVNFFGWQFPQLVESSDGLRRATGYPHSALAFYYLMLFCLWAALGVWQHRRYGVGLRRLLPGARV